MFRKLLLGNVIALAAMFMVALPVAAQEEEMSAEEKAMHAKWAEFATPGEPHQRLAEHVGTWEWSSKWWMAPDAEPEETTGGTMTATMTLDGRYLVEDWEGTMMGAPFRGHSITGYDNFRDEYVSTWIDNMGTGIMLSRGQIDPEQNALVTTGTYDDVMTGERDKTMRGVQKLLDPNTLHYEMFVTAPGGEEFKTGEIHATRKQ